MLSCHDNLWPGESPGPPHDIRAPQGGRPTFGRGLAREPRPALGLGGRAGRAGQRHTPTAPGRSRGRCARPAEAGCGTQSGANARPCRGPLRLRRSEGAQPPASLRRGRTECGPKEYAGSRALVTPNTPWALATPGRQNLHTRTLRRPIRALSTTGKQAKSQAFQRGPGGGSASANRASIASRRWVANSGALSPLPGCWSCGGRPAPPRHKTLPRWRIGTKLRAKSPEFQNA